VHRIAVLAALLACTPSPPATPPGALIEATTPAPTALPAPAPLPADHDADGVPDAQDRCPDEPEDRDQFADEDGCVDRDNDGDSVPDAHEFKAGRWTNCDRKRDGGDEVDCRDLPEDFDGFEDLDGCPDIIRVDACQIRISERLRLDRRGQLPRDAAKLLDRVARTLQAAPDIHVWVDAHIDPQRDPSVALQITQRVAEEVVDELLRRGVARERLVPRGFGDGLPLARGGAAPGRAEERRVEFAVQPCRVDSPQPAHGCL